MRDAVPGRVLLAVVGRELSAYDERNADEGREGLLLLVVVYAEVGLL